MAALFYYVRVCMSSLLYACLSPLLCLSVYIWLSGSRTPYVCTSFDVCVDVFLLRYACMSLLLPVCPSSLKYGCMSLFYCMCLVSSVVSSMIMSFVAYLSPLLPLYIFVAVFD